MSKKPRFKPRVTRVKLNPEQAVLRCSCHYNGYDYRWGTPEHSVRDVCNSGAMFKIGSITQQVYYVTSEASS